MHRKQSGSTFDIVLDYADKKADHKMGRLNGKDIFFKEKNTKLT
jgi:hypothetical protein